MSFGLAEGARGAQHIAHRLAMTPAGRSQAICGARIISVSLDSLRPAACNLHEATCTKCQRVAWAGQGNEERRAGAYA